MAGIDVGLYAKAAVITTLLLASIYYLNTFLGEKREAAVTERMNEVVEDMEEIESAYYLTEYLMADNNTCDTLISLLNHLEGRLWSLDARIKTYRDMTKDITTDEFYINEKEKLNRREVIHLSMLEKIRRQCGYNQTIILYFYGMCEQNLKCDEQGFVLSHINNRIDPEISILSFDADRDVYAVKALMEHYNATELPCVVIEGHTHCGLLNKDQVEKLLCNYSPTISICDNTAT
jgi:hypothetical protein